MADKRSKFFQFVFPNKRQCIKSGVLLICLYFFASCCCIRMMLYPGSGTQVPTQAPVGLENVLVTSSRGHQIQCWLAAHEDAGKPILIYFHGNGMNLSTEHQSGTFQHILSAGASLLAVDYAGYGNSEGFSNETNIMSSASAAYKWVKNRYPDNKIIIFGWSIGTGIACELAQLEPDHDGLVLISPYLSLSKVAKAKVPSFLVSILLWDEYECDTLIKDYKKPLFIAHGPADPIVPFIQGESLYSLYKGSRGHFHSAKGYAHNDISFDRKLWKALSQFLSKF